MIDVLVTFSYKNMDQRTYDWIICCSLRVPLLARRRKLNYPTGKKNYVCQYLNRNISFSSIASIASESLKT